jgi:hypothetical protein
MSGFWNALFGGPIPQGGGAGGENAGGGGGGAPGEPGKTDRKKVREWQSSIRKQKYKIERDINNQKREQDKLKGEVKSLVSKGRVDNAKAIVKGWLRYEQSVARLNGVVAQLNSLELQLGEIAGAFKGVPHPFFFFFFFNVNTLHMPTLRA